MNIPKSLPHWPSKPMSSNGEIFRMTVIGDGQVDERGFPKLRIMYDVKFSGRELFALYHKLEKYGA